MNDLVILEKLNPLEIFTPQGTEDILDRITKEAKSVVLDISTPDGRKNVASVAYKVAKSKTFLDDMGKDLVSAAKEQVKLVDNERKRIRDTLDALKEEIRAPLTEWENAEKERIAKHEGRLALLDQCATYAELNDLPSSEIEGQITKANEISACDWQEFYQRASKLKDEVLSRLDKKLEARRKSDTEQAELTRLRQEAAERERRQHEERIAAEAAAKAKQEAEAAARAEADALAAKVKAEREAAAKREEAAQREKAEAEDRAKRAEDARIAAEAKAKADRQAAEEKARLDAIAAAEKAKRDAEAAVQRERDRVEAERKAEAEALAKREADKKHRAKVNNEALDALLVVLAGDNLLTAGAAAKAVIQAIAKGEVPHIAISY